MIRRILASVFALLAILSCSNSEQTIVEFNIVEAPTGNIIDYLPLDDTEYPYADIPRIVIETENNRAIKDRETEYPARLQIWGEKAPESEILELTIRGRGNTSWENCPKKGYKLEFKEKVSFANFASNKDWVLIANYTDKTLLKNHIASKLSIALNAPYTPKNDFVELYLNNEYLGVYLISETIKPGKHRVKIQKKQDSFIAEVDSKHRENETFFLSKDSLPIRIHYPKQCDSSCLALLSQHINDFETYLHHVGEFTKDIDTWIDIDDYITQFWINEFTRNPDSGFNTSLYFTWEKGNCIKMGPAWDFDLAFGGHPQNYIQKSNGWYTVGSGWNGYLFRSTAFINKVNNFFKNNKETFKSIPDLIDSNKGFLNKAAKNNFKRWNILESTQSPFHFVSYKTYDDAVDSLKSWSKKRYEWIDNEITTTGVHQWK